MSTYNFDDYLKKKGELGLSDDEISAFDLDLARKNPDAGISLLTYKNDFKNAQTDTARALAHANAEEIRARYGGYSGGDDGSGFALKPADAVYESAWGDAIKAGLKKMQGARFSFDPATDERAKAYRDIYTREGERAMKDTLGEIAARTGGNASSYATAAAAQANNYYMQQLSDKYAELYNDAYNEFLSEYQRQASELGVMQGLEESDYAKFITQKELDMQKESAKAAAEQQALENLIKERSLEVDESKAWNDRFKNNEDAKLAMAKFALEIGDFDTIEKLGYDVEKVRRAFAQQYGTEERTFADSSDLVDFVDSIRKQAEEDARKAAFQELDAMAQR